MLMYEQLIKTRLFLYWSNFWCDLAGLVQLTYISDINCPAWVWVQAFVFRLPTSRWSPGPLNQSIRGLASEIGDLETALPVHVGDTAVMTVILRDIGETQLSACGILAWAAGRCCVCRRKSEQAALLKSGILKEYKIGFTNELPKLKKLSTFINRLFMLLPRAKYSTPSATIGR